MSSEVRSKRPKKDVPGLHRRLATTTFSPPVLTLRCRPLPPEAPLARRGLVHAAVHLGNFALENRRAGTAVAREREGKGNGMGGQCSA